MTDPKNPAPAVKLSVTGFRGNPLRVVLSSGHEATVTQKLIDAFASPSPFDLAEPHKCPICDVPFKADDICATDIEMGTVHAECLDGCHVVDLDTGEPTDKPLTTFQYEEIAAPGEDA